MRDRLGLTIQDVERISREIAHRRGSQEYILRHRWVTQLETRKASLSIPKLHSLMTIYRCDLSDVLLISTRTSSVSRNQLRFICNGPHLGQSPRKPKTYLPCPGVTDRTTDLAERRSTANCVKTGRAFRRHGWKQRPRRIPVWPDWPRRSYVYPVLRPGMWVRIDPQQNRIQSALCGSELERPIYLVELRDGYVCGWCEIEESD